MKKTIKRISALIAILVLSMTIAVPVTAVEYDELDFGVYGRPQYLVNDTYVVYDENDVIVLDGSFSVVYFDTNKRFNASTVAYTTDAVTEDHTFGASVFCRIYNIGEQDRTIDETDFVHSYGSSPCASFSETLSSAVHEIDISGTIVWGDAGSPHSDGSSYIFEPGTDFNY